MLDLVALQSQVAIALSEAAKIAVRERDQMKAELKVDGSIVTNADFAVETYLKEFLLNALPGSEYWGEEAGNHYSRTGKDLWLVDPIDGTSNFRYGLPLWGISVGLMREGRLVLGGIILPDLHETYLGVEGHGATLNGNPLAPIQAGPIEPHELVSVSFNRYMPFGSWPGKMRLSGAFVIDGTFVASGRFRGLIGNREKLYDVAACVVICRELGAIVEYADGSAWNETDYLDEQPFERPWVIFPRGSGWNYQG